MTDKLPEPQFETWSPADAQMALDTTGINRNISDSRVDQYARDMVEGRWGAVTTVMFNDKGELIDGQHRAAAQVKAGATLPWLVLRGVPNEWQKTLDSNFVRNVAQQMKMTEGLDQPYAMILVAVARNCYRVVNGMMAGGAVISTPEVYEIIEKHPDLRESARIALDTKLSTLTPIPPNVMGIAHWMIKQVNGQEVADWFINKVTTMDGESSKTVIGALNRRCNELKRQRVKVPHRDYLSMMIRTWNLVAENKHQGRIYSKTKTKTYVLPQVKKVKAGVVLDAAA